ncbi:MAG: PAS domain S-box protein, partial [Salegentibacter sp.]
DNRIGGLLMHSIDISQKKEAERAKKEKENLLETILDKIDVGIISCDEKGKLTLFNRAIKEWHGLPPADIPQSELQEYYGLYRTDGNTPLETHEIPLIKALREGAVNNEEMLLKPKNGKSRLLTVTGSELRNPDGKLAGAVVALHDITQRKVAEEKLRISEEAFRGNFENAAIGMAILTPRGQWLEVNSSLCKMLGYSANELKELTFQDITHQEDLRKDLLLLKELLAAKRDFYVMEKRYTRKDGELVYALLYISLVRDAKNEPLHLIAQITDVTAQKVAEQKLVEALSRIEGLLEASSQVSIIGTDTEGKVTVFNRGAENLLGYSRDEVLLKRSLLDFHLKEEVAKTGREMPGKEKKHGFDVLGILAGKDKFDTREWSYVRKDDSRFPVQVTLTAIKEEGILTGYLAVAADISEIKKVEKEVKSLLDVTKDQNDRLRNFAHIVSHNLRSHSGNLAMLLDLYIQENPEVEENEMIRHLITASQNLKETITHLNEVVLINTSVNDNLLSLNLTENVDQAIRNVSALAEEADVEIINEISPEVNIMGLPAYLDSILLNFLTNGIKYSSADRDSYIRLSTTRRRKFTVLNIEDNGLGIDLKKFKSKLFGMYKTFHTNKDARGIGLFITKNQIEAIGGKIEVESEVNAGTTFKIFLKHEKN